MSIIDESAVVDPSAQIGEGVFIGPGSIIGANCIIGDGTQINPYVVIKSNTRIGKDNRIYSFVVLGEDPQILDPKAFQGRASYLEIGDNNIIREFVNIHRGSEKTETKTTKIGNNNFIMSHAHIGHDCVIGDHVILTTHAVLGGHVLVKDHANIGGSTAVHQFCKIGEYAMVSGASGVSQDVLPYIMVSGNPAKSFGINSRGLMRASISEESRYNIKQAYRLLFREGLPLAKAVEKIQLLPESPELKILIEAVLNSSKRGISSSIKSFVH